MCTALEPVERCWHPTLVESWLRESPLELIDVDETSGSSGAKLLTVSIEVEPDRYQTLRAKWREHESSLFNDARKEIAAYATQKVVFEPHEYVVPPTTGRCIPLPEYRRSVRVAAEPTFEGADCVFGSLSYWLENVEDSQPYSEQRFASDLEYASALADLNLFTFLIQHGDTHDGNFLVEGSESESRMYSPDNAIAFSSLLRNPRDWLGSNWYELRVPALRSLVVERLRGVDRDQLGWLRSVEQYRISQGRLVPRARTGLLPGDDGIRRVGQSLQVGLSEREVDNLYDRIRAAVQRVDSGRLGTF